MKKPRNVVQVPQGGWRYIEPATGVKFEHTHWKAFLEAIFKHREANGLNTSGDWVDDVWDGVCRQNPQLDCADEGAPDRRMTLADARRFAVTFSNWLGSGGQIVSHEEAERRAAICVKCPSNKVLAGCWGCKGPLRWIVELKGAAQTSLDADLHSCEHCYCILQAKVHIPLGSIDSEGLTDLPEWCWMRDAA